MRGCLRSRRSNPLGIFNNTLPLGVGAFTSAPNAASLAVIVIGKSRWDVVAFSHKVAVRTDGDFDQRIAAFSFSGRGRAFAPQTQNLPVLYSSRNCDVQRAALRKDDFLLCAIDGVEGPVAGVVGIGLA